MKIRRKGKRGFSPYLPNNSGPVLKFTKRLTQQPLQLRGVCNVADNETRHDIVKNLSGGHGRHLLDIPGQPHAAGVIVAPAAPVGMDGA